MTFAINATAFPLAGDVMCPARGYRKALRVRNPAGNDDVTITYPSGFVEVLGAGDRLRETSNCPQGVFLATGTSTQTLLWEEEYV